MCTQFLSSLAAVSQTQRTHLCLFLSGTCADKEPCAVDEDGIEPVAFYVSPAYLIIPDNADLLGRGQGAWP